MSDIPFRLFTVQSENGAVNGSVIGLSDNIRIRTQLLQGIICIRHAPSPRPVLPQLLPLSCHNQDCRADTAPALFPPACESVPSVADGIAAGIDVYPANCFIPLMSVTIESVFLLPLRETLCFALCKGPHPKEVSLAADPGKEY